MTACNIEGAVKFLDDLQSQIDSSKTTWRGKKVISDMVSAVNTKRGDIKNALSFSGSRSIDIHNPYKVELTESEKKKQNDDIIDRVKDNYSSLAREIISFVKDKKKITVDLSKELAINVISSTSGTYAIQYVTGANSSLIRYPDFDSVLKDNKALRAVAKKRGITVDRARSIAEAHRKGGFLGMTKLHEHIHAGAKQFMDSHPNDRKTRYVNTLYKRMLGLARTDRNLDAIQEGYWKENVDEFLAVALSNPDMIAYLDKMPAKGFTSMMHRLVNTVASMVGINLKSENAALLNVFLQMTEHDIDGDVGTDTSSDMKYSVSEVFKDIDTGELSDIIEQLDKCKNKG